MSDHSILLVEDDRRLAEFLGKALEREGQKVLWAGNGADALRIAGENGPKLVILDVMLPDMSGMLVLHDLRKEAWGKTMPVIVLTNLTASDDIMRGVVSDAPSYYLVKADVSMEDIVEKIRSVLEGSKSL